MKDAESEHHVSDREAHTRPLSLADKDRNSILASILTSRKLGLFPTLLFLKSRDTRHATESMAVFLKSSGILNKKFLAERWRTLSVA